MSTRPGGTPVRSPVTELDVAVLETEREQQQQDPDLGGQRDEVLTHVELGYSASPSASPAIR